MVPGRRLCPLHVEPPSVMRPHAHPVSSDSEAVEEPVGLTAG